MNNKIFFSFMVFVFSPLIASENPKDILDEQIEALIQKNNDVITSYRIIETHKMLNYKDLGHAGVKNQNVFVEWADVSKVGLDKRSQSIVEIEGFTENDKSNISVEISDKDIFQQRIKYFYDL